jgi:hypothetical protein
MYSLPLRRVAKHFHLLSKIKILRKNLIFSFSKVHKFFYARLFLDKRFLYLLEFYFHGLDFLFNEVISDSSLLCSAVWSFFRDFFGVGPSDGHGILVSRGDRTICGAANREVLGGERRADGFSFCNKNRKMFKTKCKNKIGKIFLNCLTKLFLNLLKFHVIV